ncbi:MAG: HlyD family efflux transporter periplasmic adaptor subunit [Bacteroidota bacterium]|nr:HlyD family efflux transporter periplasmic adaptor subunit [Bacteroidota bacterium]
MKNIIFTVIVLSFFLSCDNSSDKADAYGNFEAKEIIISSKALGQINEFNAVKGQIVKEGDTICAVNTELLRIKKEQMLSQKKAVKNKFSGIMAQVDVLLEKKEMLLTEKKRLTKLFKDSAATQKQMDNISAELDILLRQTEQVKTKNQTVFDELNIVDKQIKYIDLQIKNALVINPITGTILEKYTEQHEMTMPGKPLYKVADLSTMKLKAYVSGDQLSHIKIGSKVQVQIDKSEDENYSYNGVISSVADKAEFTPKIIQTKKERVNLVYAVEVRVKNDGKIKIGMPGELFINKVKTPNKKK